MFDKLFPHTIDNRYHGATAALWILGILVLLKGGMGLNCIFNGQRVATMADGIPLDAFTPAGASAVVTFLALWGMSMVLLSLFGLLTLVRYRAMVPLALLLLLAEHIGRKAIFLALPIETAPSPAVSINAGFLLLTAVALVLSVWHREEPVGATT